MVLLFVLCLKKWVACGRLCRRYSCKNEEWRDENTVYPSILILDISQINPLHHSICGESVINLGRLIHISASTGDCRRVSEVWAKPGNWCCERTRTDSTAWQLQCLLIWKYNGPDSVLCFCFNNSHWILLISFKRLSLLAWKA